MRILRPLPEVARDVTFFPSQTRSSTGLSGAIPEAPFSCPLRLLWEESVMTAEKRSEEARFTTPVRPEGLQSRVDRPRERLLERGPAALSDADLLALVL